MSTSIYMSLLVLLILCFSSTSFADCPSRSIALPLGENQKNPNSSNINILFLEFSNDLPPNWPDRLSFIGTGETSECGLEHGKPFGHVYNTSFRKCLFISGKKIIDAVVYDPRVDSGHPNVYWSIRADGAYKSWNKVKWTKYASWTYE
ncbi:hypothetical protein TanjilG_11533 [Lupinus angustifolius]|uniref:S-protein homolog n=1 Tax=Lupinus angustifolius TaxID=3871 RepID=A0A1J7H1R7_LUPAN|nr:PREDICTED: uncharacterized protein LOC109354175 [Lupinus angustifolius]OIW06808.1 hypothetical protein TanjilG_11533 [Lupinus angustifolius]